MQNQQTGFKFNIFNLPRTPVVPTTLDLNLVSHHSTIKTTGTPIDLLLQSKDLMAGAKRLESQDNNPTAQERNGEPKVNSKKSKPNKRERKRQKAKDAKAKDASEKKSNKCQEACDNNDEESTTTITSTTTTTNNNHNRANNKGGKSGNLTKKESAEAESLRKLALDSVVPMTEQEAAATNNRFKCKLCDAPLRDKDVANRHVRSKQHRKTIKDLSASKMLRQLPKIMSPAKMNGLLDVLIDQVCHNKDVLTCQDREIRTELMEQVQRVLNNINNNGRKKDKKLKYKLQLYGSSLHLCGFKASDLNLNLRIPHGQTAPSTLIHAREMLENSDTFVDVNCCFRAKDPHILFTDPKTRVKVRLCVNSEQAVYTSRLLWIYMKLDYRLRQLCMVFRSWAHICRLDRQNVGSMPPHAFMLMSIFFMQRKRFLPILTDFICDKDMTTVLNSLNKTKLLRTVQGKVHFYPRVRGQGGSNTPIGDADNFEYDWNDSDEEVPPTSISRHCIDLSSRAVAPPSNNVARLWLDMLKFYAFTFNLEDLVVDTRSGDTTTRSQLYWAKKRIAIVDPYYPKRNLCKSMNAQIFHYMMNRLQFATFYFHGSDIRAQRSESHIQELCDDLDNLGVSEDGDDTNGDDDEDVEASTSTEATVAKNHYSEFEFSVKRLTGGRMPITVCALCKETGHERKNCPQDTVGLLELDIGPINDTIRENLEQFCLLNYEQRAPDRDEVNIRQKVCQKITNWLRQHYDNSIVISLFGSSRNGFGFKGSDLDMCMTFRDEEDPSMIDAVRTIQQVGKTLRRNPDIHNVHAITTAKVPIVKFEHKETALEGDISLYNTLALCNTKMLRMYCDIDERCQLLGYAMKSLVKSCHIGDASRGSLSSYAYTLMVIYYLQQCDPPVLPVLQEIKRKGVLWDRQIDGWNAYYFDSLEELPQYWQANRNTQSVADLWVGLLRFYSSEFNFADRVVCIRQKAVFTVFEKEWTAKCVCIEDPFALNHNLGGGLSRKMVTYIIRVLGRACVHFSAMPNKPVQPSRILSFYLDGSLFTKGEELPNDGCCKCCGKIGHYARDCPAKKRGGNGGNNKDGDDEGQKCFNCGQSGHLKRKCPHPKSTSHNHSAGGKNGDDYNQQRQNGKRANNNSSVESGQDKPGSVREFTNSQSQGSAREFHLEFQNMIMRLKYPNLRPETSSSSSTTPPSYYSPTSPKVSAAPGMNNVGGRMWNRNQQQDSRELPSAGGADYNDMQESSVSRSKPRAIPNNHSTGVPMPSAGPPMRSPSNYHGNGHLFQQHNQMGQSNSVSSGRNMMGNRRRRDSDGPRFPEMFMDQHGRHRYPPNVAGGGGGYHQVHYPYHLFDNQAVVQQQQMFNGNGGSPVGGSNANRFAAHSHPGSQGFQPPRRVNNKRK